MSAQAEVAPRSESTYKQRIATFLDSRRGKMFGFAEVAALAGSCFVLLLVLLSYLYFLVPARSRVRTANDEKTRLQTNLKTLDSVVKQGHDTKTQVDEIATSLTGFENTYLPSPDKGRLALYDELNQLIVKNNLRNTSGPTYAPLDPTGTKAVSGKTTTTKWQSFYPGIAVLVTVEGQYTDIRHFVRDLERSRQFVIINEVELQRANENNSAVAVEDTAAGPKGSLISLQMNLTTYFQRGNATNDNGQGQ